MDWKKFLTSLLALLLHVCFVGLILFPSFGDKGIAILLIPGFVSLICLCYWGDRIILGLTRSRKVTQGGALAGKISNLAFERGLPTIKLYQSSMLPRGILCIQSFTGQPVIILGSSYKELPQLSVLLDRCMDSFERKDALLMSFIALIFLFWTTPLSLMWAFLKRRLRIVTYFFEQISHPFLELLQRNLTPDHSEPVIRDIIACSKIMENEDHIGKPNFWIYNCIMFLAVFNNEQRDFYGLSTQS
jgi:hypothetical protein